MNGYRLDFLTSARAFIDALPQKDRAVIADAVRIIQSVPHGPGTQLTEDLYPYRRLKKGRWRIFYRIDETEKLIRVLFVGFRKEGDKKDAYRLFRKLIGG